MTLASKAQLRRLAFLVALVAAAAAALSGVAVELGAELAPEP